VACLDSLAATLVGMETQADSTMDLTPRPSNTNFYFPFGGNLEYNVLDDYDPISVLPPSSPDSDYYLFSGQDFNCDSGVGIEQQEGVMDAEELNPCHGQKIEWIPGSIWETYAYAQHDIPSMAWTPIGFAGSKFIKIRSKSSAKRREQYN
jgi:hypothetical protein